MRSFGLLSFGMALCGGGVRLRLPAECGHHGWSRGHSCDQHSSCSVQVHIPKWICFLPLCWDFWSSCLGSQQSVHICVGDTRHDTCKVPIRGEMALEGACPLRGWGRSGSKPGDV